MLDDLEWLLRELLEGTFGQNFAAGVSERCRHGHTLKWLRELLDVCTRMQLASASVAVRAYLMSSLLRMLLSLISDRARLRVDHSLCMTILYFSGPLAVLCSA